MSIAPHLLGLALALLGQAPAAEPPPVADGRNTPDERLGSMRAAMKSYDLTREGDRLAPIKVRDEPAFRVGRQKGNFLDGAIFLWLDEVGRPEAAMEAFLLSEKDAPDGKWIHEFTSLSTAPVAASLGGKPRWHPAGPGLKFQPVPGAPGPAATPAQRLRQARAIADDFAAEDNFGDRGWTALRMLTTPIARYGKPGATPEDGALFAFVEGTDPEVFLFVEVRPGEGGPGWHYALAPMGCWAVKVKRQGREVWDLPRRSTGDPKQPLYTYQFWP